MTDWTKLTKVIVFNLGDKYFWVYWKCKKKFYRPIDMSNMNIPF